MSIRCVRPFRIAPNRDAEAADFVAGESQYRVVACRHGTNDGNRRIKFVHDSVGQPYHLSHDTGWAECAFLRHAHPVLPADVPATPLMADGLGVVQCDAFPDRATHQIVQRRQGNTACRDQQGMVFGMRFHIADQHIEDNRIE